MPEVDLVLGNAEKLTADAYRAVSGHDDSGSGSAGLVLPAHDKIVVGDIMAVRETAGHLADGFGASRGGGEERVRAFAQVQNGCDHRCTFCIIPFGRGNSRSVPMGAVVDAVRRLVEGGAQEVVLTGVDITAYGGDLPGKPRLGALVRAILRHVPELPRLRLSSIDSVEADEALLAALAEEKRLMPHLHLSLQAGDDMILKRMKRRHSRADAIRFCEAARRLRPDIAFGADLIAGFPTETDAMFANTLALVADCGLTHLHVFPFSPRPGTPAARMPQVARPLVKERAESLRAAGDRAFAGRLRAEVGAARAVLVEKPGFGRSEHYLPVRFTGGRPGAIASIRIAAADRNTLSGNEIPVAA
jgi:threonylcarbamoyladenosine tRNA methylthiotransferase MtaB